MLADLLRAGEPLQTSAMNREVIGHETAKPNHTRSGNEFVGRFLSKERQWLTRGRTRPDYNGQPWKVYRIKRQRVPQADEDPSRRLPVGATT